MQGFQRPLENKLHTSRKMLMFIVDLNATYNNVLYPLSFYHCFLNGMISYRYLKSVVLDKDLFIDPVSFHFCKSSPGSAHTNPPFILKLGPPHFSKQGCYWRLGVDT